MDVRRTRRNVLKIACAGVPIALLGACQAAAPAPAPSSSSGGAAPAPVGSTSAPAAAPTQPATTPQAPAQAAAVTPAPAASSDWDQLVAAAKKEGSVSILVAPGDVYRQIFDVFTQEYGITVELGVGNGQADLGPKIDDERKAGQYNWDVAAHSPGLLYQGLEPLGALDPLRPALILPDVLADSSWIGGFDAGYVDLAKTYGFAFTEEVLWTIHVNRSLVSQDQLSTVAQVLDPAWTGKLAMSDPRIPSAGSLMITTWMAAKGEDALRSLLVDQNPSISQDRRQVAEWVVRGEYPIGVGVEGSALSDLAAGGADVSSIQPLQDSDSAAATVGSGTGSVGLLNHAPHPHAAQLVINWLLGQEGQTVWAQHIGYNSRRTDVQAVDAEGTVDPQRQYINLNGEDSVPTRTRELQLAKQYIQ